MATQASLTNLPGSIRELVLAASEEKEYFGRTEKDQVEVSEWTTKVAQGSLQDEASLKGLDSTLLSRTFLVGSVLTAADVAVFGALHPIMSKRSAEEYYSHPSVTRYFDHLQNLPSVHKATSAVQPALEPVTFDLENMPKPDRKAEAPKKKAKAAAAPSEQPPTAADVAKEAPVAPAEPPAVVEKESAPKEKKKEQEKKKEPKEKGVKKEGATAEGSKKGAQASGGKGAPPAEAADAGEPVPSMIDLRVGHIVHVEKHPDADGLYVEQIDIGEETGPRTVVSGLVHYIPIEQMRDRNIIVVCNLKPANMRGVKSHAMVLCATSKDGKEAGIEFVEPPPNAKPGDRVYFEGEKFENAQPLSQLNPKKKIFETVQPGFTTLENRDAAWVDAANGNSVHRIRTKDGYCRPATLVGASLS